MAGTRLLAHRRAWQEKPALRRVYHDAYRRMLRACRPGRTLEIGGGTGNFKEFAPDVVSTDIQTAPWLDVVCDAHALPFADASFDNIVMVDVLHHLARPRLFFAEAERLLRPKGRVVLLEPAITPASWLAYTLFHPEPVRLRDDPLAPGTPCGGRDPYEANQAVPTLLFGPVPGLHRRRFARAFPALRPRRVTLLGLFAYPLSGGFRRWSLLPAAAVEALLALEELVAPVLGPLLAFRMLVVLERA